MSRLPEETHPLNRHPMTDNNESEYDCKKHEINLPTGYDECPRCTQETTIEAQRQHKATRDPTLEPW